jgi:hypothetical protein
MPGILREPIPFEAETAGMTAHRRYRHDTECRGRRERFGIVQTTR